MDLLIKKAIERLKEKQEIDLKEFRRQMSFLRLSKEEMNQILKTMKRKNLIEIDPKEKKIKLLIRNAMMLLSLILCYFSYLIIWVVVNGYSSL